MKILITSLLVLCSSSIFAGDYLLNSNDKCHGHSKVSIGSRKNNCIGMVVDKGEGLSKPRKIVQVSSSKFIITDMFNWNKNSGILWLLDTSKTSEEGKLTKIFTKLNLPHGLRIGNDGLIYVGEAHQIFRFSLDAPNETKEIVVTDLPVEGKHPLTEFLITKDNRLIVNVGAPSDQCLNDKSKAVYPCLESKSEALLREYILVDGKAKFLGNLAYGLRNSMGLVENEAGDIIQFNNGMDFSDKDGPKEEINLIIKDNHYGWPYCYEMGKLNSNYKRTLFNRKIPNIDCSKYSEPIGLLPAHSAPLDAQIYDGEMFPELTGKALVSLHGYEASGQKVIAVDVNNQQGINDFEEIVFGWDLKEGIRAKGAPVGIEVGSEGEIYFVDDKNKTVMVLAKGESQVADEDPSSNSTHNRTFTKESLEKFKKIQTNILNKNCISCHSNLNGDAQTVVAGLMTSGLVKAKNSDQSEFYLRLNGQSENMAMPPGANDKITEEDLQSIREWIDSL